MDTRVKNDGMEWVQNNRHTIVGKEDTKDKAGDDSEETCAIRTSMSTAIRSSTWRGASSC